MGCPKPVSVNFATGLTNVRYEDPFTATNLVATQVEETVVSELESLAKEVLGKHQEK